MQMFVWALFLLSIKFGMAIASISAIIKTTANISISMNPRLFTTTPCHTFYRVTHPSQFIKRSYMRIFNFSIPQYLRKANYSKKKEGDSFTHPLLFGFTLTLPINLVRHRADDDLYP